MAKLILIRGLPGSGKSTRAKELVKMESKAIHVEADTFHTVCGKYEYNQEYAKDAHEWCRSKAAFWLRRDWTVIVSNTFTTRKGMDPYFEMAKRYNADITILTARGNFGSVHSVPEDIVKKMAERWEEEQSYE